MTTTEIDPLRPDLETVTPEELILDLTPAQMRVRLDALIAQANDILDWALAFNLDGKRLVGTVVLFSGGNDSTVLTHLMHRRLGRATHAGHANTGIGVPATNQFVRDVCADWGLELLEKHPPVSYDELVLKNGFPGAGSHFRYYQRLKERCLRMIRRDLVLAPRRERVLYVAGRRRAESGRRGSMRASGEHQVPLWEREGSVIWASPLAMWTKIDLVFYRAVMDQEGDPVPFNPVTDHLGMSGECLCGCFAQPGELDRLRVWYPAVAARIEALQDRVVASGKFTGPRCGWGHGLSGKALRGADAKVGKMCSSCDFRAGEVEAMLDPSV